MKDLPIPQDIEQIKVELEKRELDDLQSLQLKAEIEKEALKNLSITQNIEEFKTEFEKRGLKDLPVAGMAEIGKGDKDQEEGKEPKQQVKSWKRRETLAAASCKDSV